MGMKTAAELTTQNAPWSRRSERKEPSELSLAIERIGVRKRFKSNEQIYGEKESAAYFYKVVSGCVRSYTVVEDGRRLIAAFYLRADIFGLEHSELRAFSSEAVSDAEILVISRDDIMRLAARENAAAGDLWAHVANELHRTQNHLLLLNKSASERVIAFLLEMSDRIQPSGEIELPMSRPDIADYLGLNSETVSRILRKLEDASVITLPTIRRIVLRDRASLEQMLS
jgi:CRP/FNR family transcriptional regulator, nitrogen fixation regulation protein